MWCTDCIGNLGHHIVVKVSGVVAVAIADIFISLIRLKVELILNKSHL